MSSNFQDLEERKPSPYLSGSVKTQTPKIPTGPKLGFFSMNSGLKFAQVLVLSILAGLALYKFTDQGSFVLCFLKGFGVIFPPWTIYASFIYPFYLSPLRNIPTAPGFPLWGQFLDIVTEEVGIPQRRWHKAHGPIVRYFFPFGTERLCVAEDDMLKQMTVRNVYNYPKPLRAKLWMVRILGDGVLLSEGHSHVVQRKSLAPGFSTQSIRALFPVFWQKSLLLAKLWEEEMARDNVRAKNFEVLDWLNRTTLDIIGQAGFGTSINSLENPSAPLREAYRMVFAFDFVSRALHGLAAYIPSTKHLPAKMNRDMLEARDIIVKAATSIITEKVDQAERQTNHKDILAMIAKDNMKAKEAGETSLSFETMRDQVMTFLGAGHDTTATGVAWTLHLLAKHPDVQDKLRAEIHQYMPFLFDPARRQNPEELSKVDPDLLPYLDNVCRESLRYIPPIPMTVRKSIADDHLGEHFIPAGTTIYIHANAINRLPMYWGDNADVFDPDRWDNLPATFTTNAFMTFLHGPRGCIGRKFAESEMKMLLCTLLSSFSFKPDAGFADPEEVKMWRLVLRPKDGISLRASLL